MGVIETLSQVSVGFIGGMAAGVVGPYMSQAKDRHAARSAATEKVADLEGCRWGNDSYGAFRRAIGLFRAAAIGTRLPKPWVDQYIGLCKVIYGMRRHPIPDGMPEREHKNVLEVLDDRAAQYADPLVTVLWHPRPPRTYLILFRRSTARRVANAHAFLVDDWGYTDPILGKTLRAWERRFTEIESSSAGKIMG